MLGKAFASMGMYCFYNVLLFVSIIPYAIAETAVSSITLKVLLYLTSAFLMIIISGVILSTVLWHLYNEEDNAVLNAILSIYFMINIGVCIYISNLICILPTIVSSLSLLSYIYPSLNKYNPILTNLNISNGGGLLFGEVEHRYEELFKKRLKFARITALILSLIITILTFAITYFAINCFFVDNIDLCLEYASFISLFISTTVYIFITHRARKNYAIFLGVQENNEDTRL